MSLERYLRDIAAEDKPLRSGALVALSNLSRQELKQFARAWGGLSAERQRRLLGCLVEMAEENVELDFDSIFLMCLESSDAEVREKAIFGLWEYEDRSLIVTLLGTLGADSSPRVRSAAAGALGKFSLLAEEGKLLPREGQKIREALIRVLRNDEECIEVRRRALEAVAPFNTHVVQQFIRRCYESDDLNLRCSSLYAMGRTGEPRWLRHLIKELKSDSPALRFEAANACEELGDEGAAPHLVPLLDDDDLQVQVAAIQALAEIGGAVASRALRRCARSEDPAVREVALEALENLEGIEDPLAFRYQL